VAVTQLKLVLGVALGILLAFLVGWFWGRSGQRDLERQIEAAQLRMSLADARAKVLQARVDVFSVNFGNASRNLEAAKTPIRASVSGLERAGSGDLAQMATQALTRIDEAQRQAGALDQGANTTAEGAATALSEIVERLPE
jgi:hypothetical protein